MSSRRVPRPRAALLFGAVSLLSVGVGVATGHLLVGDRGPFGIPDVITPAERHRLEGIASVTVANTTWMLGSDEQVRRTVGYALEHLSNSEGATRAALLVRMALVVESLDGQGALLHAACANDQVTCSKLEEVAHREARARAVAPGNQLPLALVPGHPPLGR